MRLTSYTDYALRVLLFVGSTDEAVTITTISTAYDISKEHLRKVVHALSQLGYLQTTQGRNGGIRLGMPAEKISIRDIVNHFENSDLVECFDKETNTCPISNMCTLKHVLQKAQTAFMDVLGQYKLSDLIKNPRLVIFVKQAAA
ncbi:MAG: Rrf2 family transcriptional regulator [Pseudomonadota bacterium]